MPDPKFGDIPEEAKDFKLPQEPISYPESSENETEKKIDLRQQYDQIVEILRESGMVEVGEDSELGITAIDGKRYIIPSYESISGNFERPEITEKINQGFTKLLIVPFGRPLLELIDKYKETILQNANQLHGNNGKSLKVNLAEPVSLIYNMFPAGPNPENEILYNLKQFPDKDWDGERDSLQIDIIEGKTKQEILDENGAFRVILVEDLPNLPEKEKIQTINGRGQFGSWVGPIECLEKISNDPTHENETPLTLEDWLSLATEEIITHKLVIDDFEGGGKLAFLPGTFFVVGGVPRVSWRRDRKQMYLGQSNFDNSDDDSSVRVGVKLRINS